MSRATYAELGDACATAHAMELIGDRWTYPVLRELMLGPKRFTELLACVRGITPAVLTARLREMQDAGLVEQAVLSPASTRSAYDLTGWARELAPILRELGRWAQSSPLRSTEGGLTPDAAVQAMLTMAAGRRPARATRFELRLVDSRVEHATAHSYRVQWTNAGLLAERGTCSDGRCTVVCDSSAWADVLFGGLSLQDAGATVTGDRAAVERLVDAFRDTGSAPADVRLREAP